MEDSLLILLLLVAFGTAAFVRFRFFKVKRPKQGLSLQPGEIFGAFAASATFITVLAIGLLLTAVAESVF